MTVADEEELEPGYCLPMKPYKKKPPVKFFDILLKA